MEHEKIKELKEFIERSAELGQFFRLSCGDIAMQEVVDYIKELEIENEVLRKHNIGYHVANGYELQEFAEKVIEKLKDKVNSDNVDAFVKCKIIIKEVMKEL